MMIIKMIIITVSIKITIKILIIIIKNNKDPNNNIYVKMIIKMMGLI